MRVAHLAAADFIHYYLLLPQLKALSEAGIQPVAISSGGPYVELLENEGIEHIDLEDSTRSFDVGADLRSMWSLWNILRTNDIDLLHTHNPKTGLYGRVIGRLAGVPAIVNTNHGVYASPEDRLVKKAVIYPLEAFASRFSDYELIQNVEDYELLTRTRITRPKRTVLLGNGIDIRRFNPERFTDVDRLAIRAELDISPDVPVVTTVARLVADKGLREFITAGQILGPSHQFVVAGIRDPAKSDALSETEIDAAEQSGIRFLGRRDDIDRLLAISDVFALASYREGFPRVAMEAAASGVPVVAANIRGSRQAVDDDETGLLVTLKDPKALADAIAQITNDPARAAAMGAAGRAKAVREFDEVRVLEIVKRIHAQALSEKGSQRRRLD